MVRLPKLPPDEAFPQLQVVTDPDLERAGPLLESLEPAGEIDLAATRDGHRCCLVCGPCRLFDSG